jgi:hypothetical protein
MADYYLFEGQKGGCKYGIGHGRLRKIPGAKSLVEAVMIVNGFHQGPWIETTPGEMAPTEARVLEVTDVGEINLTLLAMARRAQENADNQVAQEKKDREEYERLQKKYG